MIHFHNTIYINPCYMYQTVHILLNIKIIITLYLINNKTFKKETPKKKKKEQNMIKSIIITLFLTIPHLIDH